MNAVASRLSNLCVRWGGAVVEVSRDRFESHRCDRAFSVGHFTPLKIGVEWASKTIRYAGRLDWTDLVHEMGHVFACPDPPRGSNEWAFFGWEYALVRFVGASRARWIRANRGYDTNPTGRPFGALSPLEKRRVLRDRIRAARQSGLLDAEGGPIAIR